MDDGEQDIPLSEMIRLCTSDVEKERNRGLRYFIEHYKKFLYKIMWDQYKTWGLAQKGIDFEQMEGDIISEIFLELLRNDCRTLKGFNAVDNRTAFLGFLSTIARRTTIKVFVQNLGKFPMVELPEDLPSGDTPIDRRELFESIVYVLRAKSGKLDRNLERDIFIFNLYAIHDYTQEMVNHHPVLKKYGHRVYDNVLTRKKEILRQYGKGLFSEY